MATLHHQGQHQCPLRDVLCRVAWPETAGLADTPTHPRGLVLHVDGKDVGSQEQGSPAIHPDPVKVSVVLRERQRGPD